MATSSRPTVWRCARRSFIAWGWSRVGTALRRVFLGRGKPRHGRPAPGQEPCALRGTERGVQGGVELVAHARLVRVGHKQDQKPQTMLSPQDRVRHFLGRVTGHGLWILRLGGRGDRLEQVEAGRPPSRSPGVRGPLHLFRLRPHLRLLPRSLRPWGRASEGFPPPCGKVARPSMARTTTTIVGMFADDLSLPPSLIASP